MRTGSLRLTSVFGMGHGHDGATGRGRWRQRILSIASILVLWAGVSQAWGADFAKSFGSTGGFYTFAYATAVDASGNSYVAGSFDGASLAIGGTTLNRIGTTDAFVAKLDASGEAIWAQNYGGAGAYASIAAIAVDGEGNVYLGGTLQTADLTTPALTKLGATDALAIKIDASGYTIWARNFGGAGASAGATAIAVDVAGSVVLGLFFQGSHLTTPLLPKLGDVDAVAIKMDASGDIAWVKNFGGVGATAIVAGIGVDGSGNVHLGGYFQGADLAMPPLARIGNYDAFAIKLDSVGNASWARNFGGAGATAFIHGTAVDGAGNVYLGGFFQSGNLTNPAQTRIGIADALVLKLDASGNTTWSRNYGGGGASAYVTAIAVDGAGNVSLGGYFQNGNLTSPALARIGVVDAMVLKVDATGALALAKNHGGFAASANARAVAVDGAGNVVLAGTFSNSNLTTPPLARVGQYDAFIIKQAGVPPEAITGAATRVTANSALLNGTVDDRNVVVSGISFDYGITASYGSTVAGSPAFLLPGAGSTAVAGEIGDLTCDTNYHFRINAVHVAGTAHGSDSTFVTSRCDQSITFGALPDRPVTDPPFVLSATASSGLTVSYFAAGPCSVTGNTVTLLGIGSCAIFATQAGDSHFNAAPTVGQGFDITGGPAISLSVVGSAATTTYGNSVTFTATLSAAATGSLVLFMDGGNFIGADVVSGTTATFATGSLAAGAHTITAELAASGTSGAAVSPGIVHTVNPASSTTVVVSATNPGVLGDPVLFTAAISGPGLGAEIAGSVGFLRNGVAIESCEALPVVNGAASCATAALRPGPHSITAQYAGDGNNLASTSGPLVQLIVYDPAADADHDGVPNGVEMIEARDPLVKDNDVFGNARLFAMQQYRDFLGREGDAAGISGWTSLVTAGTYSRLQVIDAFINSAEFAGFVAPVVRLYFATFLRVPDYAGMSYNAGLVRAGMLTVTQLADFFAVSPEFQSTYGSLDDTQFVTLLYGNVLGRAPDPAGLAGWVGLLQSGYTRGQVLIGFSDSVEYQAQMANEVFTTMMYAGMLHRTPEPAGFNGWVGFLDAGTYTREQVINGFFLSTEYHGRFLP